MGYKIESNWKFFLGNIFFQPGQYIYSSKPLRFKKTSEVFQVIAHRFLTMGL